MRLCGIDEAGRGPLAGDMVLSACILNEKIEGLMDSKKLSYKKREALYEKIVQKSEYYIVSFSPQNIDEFGISSCLKRGLEEIIKNITDAKYLFDGNTNFGVKQIQTMIKADSKVAEVSAASILAKVTHDRAIIKDSLIYPEYGFESHKGYGTKKHIEMIKKYGYCKLHRKSYKIKSL